MNETASQTSAPTQTDKVLYAYLAELEAAISEKEKSEILANLIFNMFNDYYTTSRQLPTIAKQAFEQRDWNKSIELSHRRLSIYSESISKIAPLLQLFCHEAGGKDAFWQTVQKSYLTLISDHYQADLAFAFLNSVRRKIFQDRWRAVSYSYIKVPGAESKSKPDIFREFAGGSTMSATVVEEILRIPDFAIEYQDIETDAQRIADKINLELEHHSEKQISIEKIKMIDAGFYRNRGAYIVGKILLSDDTSWPLTIALLNEEDKIFADAVILNSDQMQYIFSSTLANFHVTSEYYHELAEFLHSIMPKRPLGLHYSTIGFNHVGKVAVMQQLKGEFVLTNEKLQTAPGFPGTVSIGFTSPSSQFVLKVVRDKPTENYKWDEFQGVEAVLDQYRRVHEINRTGSMLDNVIYYNLRLPLKFFDNSVLDELLTEASYSVSLHRDGVVFRHLIVQMKMTPLPIFLENASEHDAEIAVTNLGQCIKNNAAANIFNKDLDGRNYGVSKILKVYLFDYDALEELTEVKIRSNADRFDGEEDIPDWFFEDGFVFLPEEIEAGLRIDDRNLRRHFRNMHGDLLHTSYWQNTQQMLRRGIVPPINTYPTECRLKH